MEKWNLMVFRQTEREEEVLKIFKKFNTQNKHKMIPIPTFKKSEN